jgi:hypothetical protein
MVMIMGGRPRLTTADFIERARAKHGDLYDYSLVEYVDNSTKVKIICETHGEFLQSPAKHMSGQGCCKCGDRTRGLNRKVTTEDFIERARQKHGDRYDYSSVRYIDAGTEVEIICRDHGSFWQVPYVHLPGAGCRKCSTAKNSAARKFTTEQFIKKSRSVHGNKYDYSLVIYLNNSTKVRINCPDHGEFLQNPNAHMRGGGCSNCAADKTRTRCSSNTDEFISKAIDIHGDKYDYSNVVYINNNTSVIIRCSNHGEFNQTPQNHLIGQGCARCGKDISAKKRNMGTTGFVDRARLIHGDLYDYTGVKYVRNDVPVEMACRKHGKFYQTPANHLNAQGCPTCGILKRSDSKRIDLDIWLDRFRSVHGDRYDYTNITVVKSGQHKLPIICRSHGTFLQNSANHYNGKGCPICGGSGYSTDLPGILYFVRFDLPGSTLWKIGITNRSVKTRFAGFKVKPIIIWQRQWDDGRIAAREERRILRGGLYDDYRYTGEPLLESGNTECFTIDIMQLGNTTRVESIAA